MDLPVYILNRNLMGKMYIEGALLSKSCNASALIFLVYGIIIFILASSFWCNDFNMNPKQTTKTQFSNFNSYASIHLQQDLCLHNLIPYCDIRYCVQLQLQNFALCYDEMFSSKCFCCIRRYPDSPKVIHTLPL